jgi:hypothetical protein
MAEEEAIDRDFRLERERKDLLFLARMGAFHPPLFRRSARLLIRIPAHPTLLRRSMPSIAPHGDGHFHELKLTIGPLKSREFRPRGKFGRSSGAMAECDRKALNPERSTWVEVDGRYQVMAGGNCNCFEERIETIYSHLQYFDLIRIHIQFKTFSTPTSRYPLYLAENITYKPLQNGNRSTDTNLQ